MAQVTFSIRQCYALMRKAGARLVCREAAKELSDSLEGIALEIAKLAVLYADDYARLKVTRQDVKSALKEYMGKRME